MGKNKKRLAIVFGLTAAYMVSEVVAGLLTNSLTLLADAGHMLTDAGALGLALFAVWFAERRATPEKTYGFYRVEILAALANAVLLIFISLAILYEAWLRFEHPPEVVSRPMLIVAVVGLGVNLVGMSLLKHGHHESLNVKAAYLEVLSDMIASVGVIVSGVIMLTTKWYRIDPLIGAGISLFILPRTWSLLKQATHILMEGTPAHIDIEKVETAMKEVGGIKAVHDLHIWTITSGVEAMSAHVTVENPAQGDHTLSELQGVLKDRFGIDHTTIQLEEERCQEKGRH